MFAKTFAFAATFVLPLLLVRKLSQAEFGLYKQVFLVATTAVSLLPMGFSMSAFYYLAREEEKKNAIILNILLVHATIGMISLLALACFPSLLVTVFNSPELGPLSPLLGVMVLVWTLSTLLDAFPVAYQELKLASLLILVSQVAKTILLLAAALMFGTVQSLVVAGLLYGLVQLALLAWYVRSRFPGVFGGIDWAFFRAQLSYAWPLGLAGLLFFLQSDLHHYLVSYFYGPALYAVYAVGCFQLPLVGILFESVGSILIPKVSVLHKEERHREVILLMARVMRKLAAFYFPLYVFLMLFGREFLVALFTPKFLDSWPIFAINLTTLPFYCIMLDSLQRSYAELRYFFLKLRVAAIVVLVPALVLATMHFGLIGAILVAIASNLLERTLGIVYVSRLLGITRADLGLLRDVGKIALASAAAGAAAAAVRFAMPARPLAVLIVCGLAFGVAYLAAVLALGIVTPDEHAILRGKLAHLQQAVARRRAAFGS
jgi:O-antigen/teichoic acid export membrane protein